MTNREHVTDIELQNVPLPQRRRTRGLPSQISTALLQPVYFFRTLPRLSETRQWLWVGLLILFLIGFSAVRYKDVTASASGGDVSGQPPMDFGMGGFEGDGGGLVPGGSIPGGIDFGGIPDMPSGGETPSGSANNPSDVLTTGFIAASEIVVSWFGISLLLIIVSLLRGWSPRLGHNFQIAIWATLPLALMALLQVLYLAAGGIPGEPGLSGLLADWEFYQQQGSLTQDVIYSLSIRLTLFWIWALVLLYFGARHALQGPRLGALFVTVFWAVLLVVVPVASGAVAAPQVEDPGMTDGIDGMDGQFPPDGFPGEFPDGFPGGFPPDQMPPDVFAPDLGDAPETGDEFGTEEADGSGDTNQFESDFTDESELTDGDDSDAGSTGNTGSENIRPSVPPVERSAEVEPTP